MSAPIALVRPVSPRLGACELTHLERVPIDVPRAAAQHAAYEATLARLGATVVRLPARDELPDAVFVEDAAVVLDEVAVIARAGVASRRAESDDVAAELARHRPLLRIAPPGTLEGGDVLRLGRTLVVGVSGRTNAEGVGQLRGLVEPLGYAVVEAPVRGALHLKTAVSSPGEGAVLLNPAWVDRAPFDSLGLAVLEVPGAEPWGANVLPLGGAVVAAAGCPGTAEMLRRAGYRVEVVEIGEMAKAEAGVTCSSIILASGA